jgi:soluble lytic murein transglycosylase-like protein
MEAKILVHRLIRELILESSGIDPALLGSVGGNSAIVLGPQARKLLASSGLTPEEIAIVSNRINNIKVSDFRKYDHVFRNHASAHGLKPSLLKAMSIEETTLGIGGLANTKGSTAAGLIQITKPTLDTLNANLPKGVHYDYEKLFTDPGYSVKVAAHYIQHFLIGKRGLKDRASILRAYKTGPDSDNYVKRVEAFKKLVDMTGV